jgi:hypothetical protein
VDIINNACITMDHNGIKIGAIGLDGILGCISFWDAFMETLLGLVQK